MKIQRIVKDIDENNPRESVLGMLFGELKKIGFLDNSEKCSQMMEYITPLSFDENNELIAQFEEDSDNNELYHKLYYGNLRFPYQVAKLKSSQTGNKLSLDKAFDIAIDALDKSIRLYNFETDDYKDFNLFLEDNIEKTIKSKMYLYTKATKLKKPAIEETDKSYKYEELDNLLKKALKPVSVLDREIFCSFYGFLGRKKTTRKVLAEQHNVSDAFIRTSLERTKRILGDNGLIDISKLKKGIK